MLKEIEANATIMHVIYPSPECANDVRFNDLIELLQAALDCTINEWGPYTLQPSKPVPESRLLAELEKNTALNIAWSSTSLKKEERFLPIRIPLRKGILGYRIGIINQYKQAVFDQIHSIDDLKKITIGQGVGWGDIHIYKRAGVRVMTALYPSLFEMIASNCFDIFPRGVSEVIPEFEYYKIEYPELAIEKSLAIYYQWPYYFFVNKANVMLAKRIESGLHSLINDGSFNTIFLKYNKEFIQKTSLKERRVIKIHNPLLPPQTPLGDASLWFYL